MYKIMYKFAFLLLLVMVSSLPAKAQFEEGKETITLMPIVGDSIFAGANKTVTYSSSGEASKKIINIVTLKINEQSAAFFKTNFTAKVYLKIETLSTITPASTLQTSFQTLTVNYDMATAAKYNVRAYILLNSAEQVKLTIDTVNITGNTGWDPSPSLQVENEMRVIRYATLSNVTATLMPLTLNSIVTSDADSVSWTWNTAANNNSSQLEWAWLPDETAGYYTSPDFIFQSNSTRVDLGPGVENYKIPLLYGDMGKLYYRVRAALRKNSGSVLTGPWSAIQNISFQGHQDNLNWQSSTSFAEEGKLKTVIQYFDGSMRNRQTVTKDNSTGNTIVAETIYDLQGRPNVQILPTPTIDNNIKYFKDFNRFIGQRQITPAGQQLQYEDPAKYFDLSIDETKCNGSPALDSTTGTGKYYSSQNSWLGGGEEKSKYIPHAEGYAYTETRFLDDATQRVSKQGGAGTAFRINNGHDTKYYYGKPGQQELDALFGTEVGDASHYSKNMVQDANGQMSVSYTDMHGRTIATALAGDSTTNLQAIYTNTNYYPATNGVLLINQLLTPASNLIIGNSIESISSILASATTNYNFTYQLDPAILNFLNCNNQQICFDCKYDLEISIRPEDCNAGEPIIKKYNNLQLASCGTSMGFIGEGITEATKSINFSQTLSAGSWIVRKTLSLNDSMYLLRKDSALKVLLCRTEQNLYDSVYNVLIKTSACNVTGYNTTTACDSCNAYLGSFATYKNKYLESIGVNQGVNTYDAAIRTQYTKDSLTCQGACGAMDISMTTLKGLRNQLLGDMEPYTGQYALKKDSIINESGVFDPKRLETKFNIFTESYTTNPGGVITNKPIYYRIPRDENGNISDYFTEDNLVDLSIEPLGSMDNSLLSSISDDEYTNLFQPSWAKSLIVYHPEFKKLQFAEANLASSYAWLDKVQACPDYATALAQNYLTPLISDPYFINRVNDKDLMSRYLTSQIGSSALSIWRLANGTVSCATKSDNEKLNCINSAKYDGIDLALNKDAVWEQFKSIYLSYRNEMVTAYLNGIAGPGYLTSTEMDSLQRQGKKLVFTSMARIAKQNNISWWPIATTLPVDTAALAVVAATYANAYNGDQCIAQKPFWKARMMQCEQLQTWLLKATSRDVIAVNNIINIILDSMVLVCNNSATAAQPMGNSTVNPVFKGLPQGFEDIINNVFKQRGITSIADSNYFCNPYTIDFPKPFGKNPPLMVNNTNTIDSCGCKRFSSLKIEAKLAGYDALNLAGTFGFNRYLALNYKDSLSNIIWTGLQKCSTGLFINNCTYTIAGAGYETGNSTPANSGCPANAVITGVSYLNTTDINNIKLSYITSSSSPRCYLQVINNATGISTGYLLTCGSSNITLSLPGCQMYNFYISTGTAHDPCFHFSNTFTLPACNAVCKKIYTPIRLQNFVVMPAFLNCVYQKPCISCNTLNTLVAEFKMIYPGYLVPYTDIATTTTSQLKQNALLARFLNFRTGFSKNALDYIDAIEACAGGGNTDALCDYKKPLNDASEYLIDTLPCGDVQTAAFYLAQLLFQEQKDSLKANFDNLYQSKCLGAKYTEQFYASYQPKEYHYTLYYYDQAGNLVKTLPPAAVNPNYEVGYLAAVVAFRQSAGEQTNALNNELLGTNYRYNSLNQVIAQKTPDAGVSKFWYDRLGRLAVSQNAKQLVAGAFSYTLYDALGRIQEVGQKPQNMAMAQIISKDATSLSNWINGPGTKEQITFTKYDEAYTAIAVSNATGAGLWQSNLRNRVSYTYVKTTDSNDPAYPWDAASFYSYDIHGNVDTLYQDHKTGLGLVNCNGEASGNRFKKMWYCYDLISGKVNDVAYQPGSADQFYHHYNYDAENRLTEVKTSKDKLYWESEARYDYYRHGPLARTVLGANQVQGLDYAYTLQGWLKGINSTSVFTASGNNSFDMGQDGSNVVSNQNSLVARDAYGFSLNYYVGDYKGIGTNALPFAAIPMVLPPQPATNITTGAQLFNGNIGAMLVNIPQIGKANLYGYKYDQLNRLVRMDAFNGLNTAANNFATTPIRLDDYHEEITYDPNGNIKNYLRNGDSRSIAMDNLGYNYVANTNRLNYVSDAVTAATQGDYKDIKNQSPNNYAYDNIGNLISDNQEGISNIDWSVYGKIRKITKNNGTIIRYGYDASGNRISKIVNTTTPVVTGDSTYYVRDASGNVMSVYNKKSTANLLQTELHLYGSSRLGVYNVAVDVQNCPYVLPAAITIFTRGNKFFELSNHLGNVLATITDKKVPHSTDGKTIDYYTADISNATDYYPFGMQMPGRNGHAVSSGGGNPGGSSGSTVIADLIVNNRNGNTPGVYEATNSILFNTGFESGTSDVFEAHILPVIIGGSSGGVGTWAGGGGGSYRYGFNGKENDNDAGEGIQDYGMRIYSERLGRFLSVDPLTKSYPWYTPYQFAGNKPIWAVDLDGAEELISQYLLKDGKATLIRKIGNIESRQKPAVHLYGNTYPQTGLFNEYNKATGKPLTEDERGTEQFQYFDKKGNRLYIRRNIEGDYVPGENENIPIYTGNSFGSIYIGKNNPQTPDGKDDYRREPQDLEDAKAMRHDKKYDQVDAKGVTGVLSKKTLMADLILIFDSQEVINQANKKGIDPYTGKVISDKTVSRAEAVKAVFIAIIAATGKLQ